MIMAFNKTQTHLHHHHHHDFTQLNQIYSHHHQDFGMMHPSSSSTPFSANFNNINKNAAGAPYMPDMDDQTLFMFINGQDAHAAQNSGMTPPTLNIFPSQPMHVDPSKASGSGLVSPGTSGSNKSSEPYMELSNPNSDVAPAPKPHKVVKREGNRKGNTSGNERPQADHDPKILRRLAQNREAARKSRLRKKAYVQQLETSRLKLIQLEQEIQRARSQGSFLFGGNNLLTGDQGSSGSINSDAAAFDMEYSRWVEVELRMMVELRKAVQDRFPEHEVQVFVEKYLRHYDLLMNHKSIVVKSDVFHILNGMWKTPAERCLMWLGDFRPSDIIKISISTLKPMPETQYVLICGLQQSTTGTEEAISRGLEAFNHSLSEFITSSESLTTTTLHPNMSTMSIAFNKLSLLESLVRQADNLRHETLHQLPQMLTPHQVARCLLAMVDYFHRLRNLNSIWAARSQQK